MASPNVSGYWNCGTVGSSFVRMMGAVVPNRWQYRRTYRAASSWSEAMRLAMAELLRVIPDAHVTVTPSHVTPTGRMVVRVLVERS